MGQLTRATIVSEGLLKAGNTSLTTRANVWFNAWLRSTYRAWPWPFLHKRATGIALAQGATSLTFGNGSTETLEVQRVLDPIWVYDSAYATRARARIRPVVGDVGLNLDETINSPTGNVGLPEFFKVRASNTVWGTWTLQPVRVPDKAYLLAVDYLVQPADISSDATVPVYPNDQTMIQCVCAHAWQYMGDERYGEGLQILASMVTDDRMKYGEVAGTNDMVSLDPGVFR